MKVLVVGSGGREHALCWALARSPSVAEVVCAPGNAGIAVDARLAPVAADDLAGVVDLARAEAADLVVVGPEAPLVAGLADRLVEAGIAVFGPSAAAAQLEASKAFTKAFCARHGVPTAPAAAYRADEAEAARAYLDERGAPIVLKADGLAAGKGVVVAFEPDEARAALTRLFAEGHGTVVIEDYLNGEEASLFVLADGTRYALLGTAQDHKRAFDGDLGPNTGGMGAYAPARVLTLERTRTALSRIVAPTLQGMAAEGRPYRGVLYAGLMLTAEGPQLIEYNVRFGDPETQALLLRLNEDFGALLMAAATGALPEREVRLLDRPAMTVVVAAEGYPGPYRKGEPIGGLDAAAAVEGVTLFHAGTAEDGAGRVVSNGGRVLNVSAVGPSLAEAKRRTDEALARLDWPGGFRRTDIGWRALQG